MRECVSTDVRTWAAVYLFFLKFGLFGYSRDRGGIKGRIKIASSVAC